MKKGLSVLLVLVLAGGAGFAGYYKSAMAGRETTDDAHLESHIVPISAKISGYVKTVPAEDNQTVKEGDLLATIDATDYKIAVDKAQAALAAVQAQVDQAAQGLAATKVSAPSSLEAAKAAVAAAQADVERAAREAKRARSLKGVSASARDIEQAAAAEKVARANLEKAQAELRTAETSPQTIEGASAAMRVLQAQAEEKKADLAIAQEKLSNTEIIAPQPGKVTNRTVRPGTYVQPGQALMAISGPEVWVVANFKETQLGHMRIGQPVDIHIDAYPKAKFTGRIESIQAGTGARLSLFPPENATGNFVKVVQRVPVKITLDAQPDSALSLVPGMSVEATVRVK